MRSGARKNGQSEAHTALLACRHLAAPVQMARHRGAEKAEPRFSPGWKSSPPPGPFRPTPAAPGIRLGPSRPGGSGGHNGRTANAHRCPPAGVSKLPTDRAAPALAPKGRAGAGAPARVRQFGSSPRPAGPRSASHPLHRRPAGLAVRPGWCPVAPRPRPCSGPRCGTRHPAGNGCQSRSPSWGRRSAHAARHGHPAPGQVARQCRSPAR